MTPHSDRTFLRSMAVIRAVEEQILSALQEGLFAGSTHLCIGQEAVPVGMCAGTDSADPVIATYRGHGWALAKGVPPVALFAEVLGRDSDLNGGRGGSAYLSAPQYGFFGENSIVGAGLPIALGLGIACKHSGGSQVPIVSIGDGAMNQGNVHESLNMASVMNIPILVVVENNGYSEMTPSDALTAVTASVRARAYGMDTITVDGNDPEAVRACAAEARAQALGNQAPVLIEAMTHRLGGHYSGDVQAYRPAGELEAKRRGDPLLRLAASLGEVEAAALVSDAQAEVSSAFEAALAVPFPTEARSHVFAS